eukprot:m.136048 g.136048  ORF g.136048 m.136048 type:complete len:340 (+) comp16965_c1_seq7:6145-7164(+)
MRAFATLCVLAVALCLLTSEADAARRRRRRRRRKTVVRGSPYTSYRQTLKQPVPAARLFNIDGVATTGLNSQCGTVLWNLAPHVPNEFSEEQVFIAGSNDELDRQSCQSALINIGNGVQPFKDTPIFGTDLQYIGDFGGEEPDFFRGRLATSYDIPITAWLGARGELNIACPYGKDAEAKVELTGLVPNAVYVLTATWYSPTTGNLTDLPFGGFPNVIVADKDGKASAHRFLGQFCPMFPVPEGDRIMLLSVDFRADGFAPRDVTDNNSIRHVSFPLMAEPLADFRENGYPYDEKHYQYTHDYDVEFLKKLYAEGFPNQPIGGLSPSNVYGGYNGGYKG